VTPASVIEDAISVGSELESVSSYYDTLLCALLSRRTSKTKGGRSLPERLLRISGSLPLQLGQNAALNVCPRHSSVIQVE